MSDPSSLALHVAIRNRLIGTSAVTDLCPAASILDMHGRPARFPSIIIGDSQLVADDLTYARNHVRIYSTLHVWTEEKSLVDVKFLSGAVRIALRAPLALTGFLDGQIEEERFLRDPDGEHAHGVLTYSALLQEIAA